MARWPDGRIAFVRGAAPHEQIVAAAVRERPRFVEAEAVELRVPSPARVTPRCAHFGVCGGCALQHVDPAAQLAAKERAVEEALVRIAKLDRPSLRFQPAWRGEPYRYRSRARVVVGERGVGFRAARSHDIVPVRECPVLLPELEAAVLALAGLDLDAGELELVAAGGSAHAVVPGLGVRAGSLTVHPDEAAAAVRTVDALGPLWLAPTAFSQSNPAGNAALLAAVGAALPDRFEAALELYAGSGNLTRVLAARADRVVALESAGLALELLRRLALPNVETVEGPVERTLAALPEARYGVALVDPPRIGMAAEVTEHLLALRPAKILYVSCDAGTFARDVGRLSVGYRLDSVRVFDFYPETPHVEILGVLKPSRG